MSANDGEPLIDAPNQCEEDVPTESGDAASSEPSPAKGPGEKSTVIPDLLKSPQALAAIQGKLDALVGQSSGYIESLPTEVKRRVDALRCLCHKQVTVEADFYKEVHELEKRFQAKFDEIYEKRRGFITGAVEPSEEESKWELSEWPEVVGEETEEKRDAEVGIPEFWLTTLKSIEMVAELILEHDEPILKNLVDIRVRLDCPGHVSPNFSLDFHFSPNEFFNNTVLSKLYLMEYGPSDTLEDVINYEGAQIKSLIGCKIDWKKGKNVTVKTIKKKQKHKSQGQTRTVSKTVPNCSFFNFFEGPRGDGGDEGPELEQMMEADFDIAILFRDRILPKAVFYFTGEAQVDEDIEEEEDEGDEYEGEDEDEDDPDYKPGKNEVKGENPPECRQQ